MKRWPKSYTIRKMQIKQQEDTTTHLLEQPKCGALTVSNAREDIERKGLLFTAAGTTKWYTTWENSLAVSYKTKHPLAI